MKTHALFALLPILFTGCFPLSWSKYIRYNIERDKVMVATVGSPMIQVVEDIVSFDGLGSSSVNGSVCTELDYAGRQGNVIKIYSKLTFRGKYFEPYYRELREPFTRRGFDPNLTFDITGNSTITYEKTTIQILEATSSEIKYVVLKSPLYEYQSGQQITDQPAE